MFVIGANSTATGYNLTRSVRLRRSASAYLNRTPASAGNRKTWTWSAWFKRGLISGVEMGLFDAVASAGTDSIGFRTDETLTMYFANAGNGNLTTTQVFRDPSAWYHIVIALDTTQATASNRVKIYLNGTQITAFTSSSYPAQNLDCGWNNSVAQNLGRKTSAADYFDGYLTEINFIDGQALTPSSFGSTNATTGVWQPAAYTGSYGTNGFELNFTDNSALTTASNVGLGKDFSGNGNYWTTNNISITAGVTYDSMTDVPTLTSATAANFATWNPLDKAGSPTFSNGNLYVAGAFKTRSTMALPTSVKTYVEIYQTGTASTVDVFCGLLSSSAVFPSAHANPGVNWYATDTIYGQLNGSAAFSFAGTLSGGAILQLAYDGSTGKVWLGINNTWYTSTGATSGNPSAGTGEFATLSTSTSWSVYCGSTTGSQTITAKFGQNGQSYTPPTGFVALNTYNLPTSTIVKGNTVMDATLWTGNSTGSTTQTITNAGGFKPDFLWGKSRSATYNHVLIDSVRGVNKILYSDLTNAEVTNASTLSSFNSNGFTVGIDAGGLNDNGKTFVGWQWQAGQGTTSSNTNGSITSTVSVNASAGFSVVTYTGTGANATVGHGLGVAPSWIVVKQRNGTVTWRVYHASLANTQVLYLSATDAATTETTTWNSTTPTSTVFSVGTGSGANGNTNTYVAYCWTPIAGYSAFGSFTGNGTTDNVFIYTGFLPKFILLKASSIVDTWYIWDSVRGAYNVNSPTLNPNTSAAETSVAAFDFLSNGFKLRNNASATYVYAAWAENPFKNSLAR